jgi:hypothetical protein
MPKSYRRKSRGRTRSRSRSRSRRQSGGYSSATTYGQHVYGDLNSQWSRTFDQNGQYGSIPSNVIIGAQGQNATMAAAPTSQNLALIQSAGKRKRRGGFMGQVVSQAVVPLALLGMQQTYRRRKHRGGKSHSRKNRR